MGLLKSKEKNTGNDDAIESPVHRREPEPNVTETGSKNDWVFENNENNNNTETKPKKSLKRKRKKSKIKKGSYPSKRAKMNDGAKPRRNAYPNSSCKDLFSVFPREIKPFGNVCGQIGNSILIDIHESLLPEYIVKQTIVFLEDKTVLGLIDQVFGKTNTPKCVIRFASEEDVKAFVPDIDMIVKKNCMVYVSPELEEDGFIDKIERDRVDIEKFLKEVKNDESAKKYVSIYDIEKDGNPGDLEYIYGFFSEERSVSHDKVKNLDDDEDILEILKQDNILEKIREMDEMEMLDLEKKRFEKK